MRISPLCFPSYYALTLVQPRGLKQIKTGGRDGDVLYCQDAKSVSESLSQSQVGWKKVLVISLTGNYCEMILLHPGDNTYSEFLGL